VHISAYLPAFSAYMLDVWKYVKPLGLCSCSSELISLQSFAQQIFTVLDDHTAAISPGLFLHSSASLKEMLETDRLVEKM